MSMNQHLPPHDIEAATALVDAALKSGYLVTVYDGEAYAITKSTDRAAILKEVGATDADKLIFHSGAGERLGMAQLIYGNGPGETIADHTDNPAISELVAMAEAA